MKQYRILTGYADSEKLQDQVNALAAEGYIIDTALQQDHCGTHICIIMVKEAD